MGAGLGEAPVRVLSVMVRPASLPLVGGFNRGEVRDGIPKGGGMRSVRNGVLFRRVESVI